MSKRPNILFLMTDQMQGRVLDPEHPCQTPNLDRLAKRGIRFSHAYTPNAVCSPARASLMTGLLPHNHGVTDVTHCVDPDQSCLRTDKPHWAQRLRDVGYETAYFGKWHVERSGDMDRFGWSIDGTMGSPLFEEHAARIAEKGSKGEHVKVRHNNLPPYYRKSVLYGVTTKPPEERRMGIVTSMAEEYLREATQAAQPWCCMVSITEPHDPFVPGEESMAMYDVDTIPLAPNVFDDLEGRPGIYRKVSGTWADMTVEEKREAAACYYALISEIDAAFGRLVDLLEETGQLEETLIVMTSDHGELLGAHGLYTKNYSGYEEVYNIPLIMAGPGIAQSEVSAARVGLHDLAPTLLELMDAERIDVPDSKSFVSVLRDPRAESGSYTVGYAEYFGTRYRLTQRVLWDGPWKYCLNGFDFDEMYNLEDDPYEMNNLACAPAYEEQVKHMLTQVWRIVRDTDDHVLYNTYAPILRAAPYGPLILEESAHDRPTS